jgi:shikimate kinase
MKPEIILLGPIGSGKTTIAELISMRTGLPRRSMDELRWKYYDEIGYDRDLAHQKHIEEGFWGLYRYWKPFEAYAVERLLNSFSECIFDLGGGQSVYEDAGLFQQVHDLLAPYSHVVLLIPSPDKKESIQILHERNDYDSDAQREVNEYFIRHHSNYDLAKFIVYTKDKDPDQICDEVLRWVRSTGGPYSSDADTRQDELTSTLIQKERS